MRKRLSWFYRLEEVSQKPLARVWFPAEYLGKVRAFADPKPDPREPDSAQKDRSVLALSLAESQLAPFAKTAQLVPSAGSSLPKTSQTGRLLVALPLAESQLAPFAKTAQVVSPSGMALPETSSRSSTPAHEAPKVDPDSQVTAPVIGDMGSNWGDSSSNLDDRSRIPDQAKSP